jgi:hypothetical protein
LHRSWTAINKIAYKNQLAVAGGRNRIHTIGLIHRVAELRHKLDKLIEAPMNVPDDVEWTVLGLLVVPKRMPFDGHSIYFLRAGELEDVADAFAL